MFQIKAKPTTGFFAVRNLSVLLTGSLLCILLTGCRSTNLPPGPELKRVSAWNSNPSYSNGSVESVKRWLSSETPDSVIRTPEERWSNGFAGCMTPFLVDWQQSDLSGSDNEYVIVHNVQVDGNPLLGISRHATIRIPEQGIERIEYVIVRYALKGPAKTSGHIQLRFVFEENRRPQLLDEEGQPDRQQPYLDDLIVSWEAWRPTNTPWKFVTGLKPDQYALTARMYSGSQRFLNDSLRGAVWDCYPLQLPNHPEAADMILWCSLMMGDSMARRTLPDMVKQDLMSVLGDQHKNLWSEDEITEARKRLNWDEIPDDWFKDLMGNADLSYHALERSCISVGMLQIELAMERLYRENNLGEREKIDWVPEGKIPDWFSDIVRGDGKGTYKNAPYAAFWALTHKEILPYKAHLPLKRADMLKKDDKGNIIRYRYGHKLTSPYGDLSRNLM